MSGTRKRKRVIVNADDLGLSCGTTLGILRAHREGIVTSATLMPNRHASAEAAAQLASVPTLGVGVHLNCSQGPPLSDQGAELADADGVIRKSSVDVILAILRRPRLLAVVEAEFDAQIRWVLDRGIRPTHLDSHRHVHGFPPIFARVAGLARRYNIRWVRWHHDVLTGPPRPAGPRAQRRNRWLLNCCGAVNALIAPGLRATSATWGIEHSGSVDSAWLVLAAGAVRPGVTEIMVHPGSGDDASGRERRLRPRRAGELAALCSAEVAEAFRRNRIELIHYGNLD